MFLTKHKYVFIGNKSTSCFEQIYNWIENVMETTIINAKEAEGEME
jgi:hypothetical protein